MRGLLLLAAVLSGVVCTKKTTKSSKSTAKDSSKHSPKRPSKSSTFALAGLFVDQWGTIYTITNTLFIEGNFVNSVDSFNNKERSFVTSYISSFSDNIDVECGVDRCYSTNYWTVDEGDPTSFYYCAESYNLPTLLAASSVVRNISDNDLEDGCGGFEWTRLERKVKGKGKGKGKGMGMGGGKGKKEERSS
ncbi:hypothetical protein TrST_g4533 [Triparma strigata]|uniref:Uncharacterized protein n=1 Tax=Triparma strigata TaxID=1606541 RepID=A0A9W6ZTP3_9STRA|nr:hypothetical protein TrST_g4533 [Triparma strigata]